MGSFEESVHHGYSREEYAAEMEEGEKRMEALGCMDCEYCQHISHTCEYIFANGGIYPKCPYFKKKETVEPEFEGQITFDDLLEETL